MVELARHPGAVLRLCIALVALLAVGASTARAQTPVYTPEQPPQQALYRDGWTNRYLLDGTWLFRADYADQGLSQGWWRNIAAPDGWTPVQVPNTYNAGDFSPQSMAGYVGWYRKDFLLPPGPGKRVWIVRFESVNFRAQVWLNGRQIGSHTGDSLPFELNLSHLHAGVNRLIVRVDNRRTPTDIPSGLARGSWTYGGIVREVYLRPVQRADLAQVIVRPILPCPTCAASIEETVVVHNVTGVPQTVRLRGSFGRVRVNFGRTKIPPHSSWTAQAAIRIAHPRLWCGGRSTSEQLRHLQRNPLDQAHFHRSAGTEWSRSTSARSVCPGIGPCARLGARPRAPAAAGRLAARPGSSLDPLA